MFNLHVATWLYEQSYQSILFDNDRVGNIKAIKNFWLKSS